MPTLYIVATPIGNLKDISLRAIETLKEVDFILAEDTRESFKLLNHYGIKKPLISYFQHSRLSKVEHILDLLIQGKNLALISDAGTPGINDPGGRLIEEVVKKFGERVQIVPIPGPNAAITALSISGFNADKFLFLGYPPHKKGRNKFFKEVAGSKHPVVFYESVHRILKTLAELNQLENLKDRQIMVARELTKKFETVYRGKIEEIIPQIENQKLGEFVVIVS
ncbi:MAG: 16S rRNA (cytidine(1402)-2'-O)-methyltransferase [Parcubacteria group bacterium RIFCSPLOWO2_01_FULL_40_65]|nr:MAG: 16S rRNA (cytidine(1402)-2'-O)-methyltransferase [Parcubacteria group bacterium RIFCSPHIGHO2_01_FULL_40_30]OHB19443.1 MAG: 16S rRNA (cytidine(1402)-2'-O)-methyltransferase [Parcubacteria group bacterium RIFCSPHIGHO2_02_FULL_40_12]OHB21605.1 MAG: 16S rRNA (cytidine(1402)-2'-O)-methyltransferase [Parcubacteria group bacterium RIFCSPLOWO2_01_FULL_40_65]OHB23472.1 MAG: 16S rRNA (cytidine(1402)-2'-O)-methyltransferase [Parcubacteria group bacterium RIFCSPLOWO2_02_FULL_40_12]OHB23714.1 MAG: 1